MDEVFYMPSLQTPPNLPYPFVYFITVRNHSDRPITLRGRKWIVSEENGETQVVEGTGITGLTPKLEPGEHFSYNSYHTVATNAEVTGSYLVEDDLGGLYFTPIPRFRLSVPEW